MQPTAPIVPFLLTCTAAIAGPGSGLLAQSSYVLLGDFVPSFLGSGPSNFVELQGKLYFWGVYGSSSTVIYSTDGTPQGTLVTVDSAVIGSQIQAEDMIVHDQQLWFVGNDAVAGMEPWVSDGTNAGTRIMADVRPGSASSAPRFFTPVGDRCAFLADTDTFGGPSLVITDGTAGGTVAVAAAGNPAPGNHRFAVLGSKVFFTGSDAATGNELWVCDTATGAATMVLDLFPGVASSNPWIAGAAHGRVFLHAQGPAGFQVWSTDGSAAGTSPIAPGQLRFELNNPYAAPPFAATASKVFIRSRLPQSGATLHVWDAATATTSQILGISPTMLCALDTICIVAGRATISSPAVVWRSDGTQAGTAQLGAETSTLAMRRVGSRHVFFVGNPPGVLDRELWRTDGTVAGTRMHVEVNPSRYGITSDLHLGVIHGGVCWSANHELYGPEPTWSAIGTGISQPIGSSCGRAEPRLVASDAALGQTMEMVGTGAFVGAFCGVVAMLPVPAPLQLTPPLGPGCHVYGNPAGAPVVTLFLVGAPSWTLPIPMPGAPVLTGVQAVFQALYGGGPTPGGLLTTNGVLCQVGL
jgi:ELWxxDGT repeat protein